MHLYISDFRRCNFPSFGLHCSIGNSGDHARYGRSIWTRAHRKRTRTTRQQSPGMKSRGFCDGRRRSGSVPRLPVSALKSAWPVLHNPANRNREIPLTFEQFRFGFANAVSEEEAHELYTTYAVLQHLVRRYYKRQLQTLTHGRKRRWTRRIPFAGRY